MHGSSSHLYQSSHLRAAVVVDVADSKETSQVSHAFVSSPAAATGGGEKIEKGGSEWACRVQSMCSIALLPRLANWTVTNSHSPTQSQL